MKALAITSKGIEDITAKQTTSLLNKNFGLLASCIEAEGNTVDKFIGGSLMSFWGAPEAIDGHAARALLAGAANQKRSLPKIYSTPRLTGSSYRFTSISKLDRRSSAISGPKAASTTPSPETRSTSPCAWKRCPRTSNYAINSSCR